VLCPWAGVSGQIELRVSNDGVRVSGRLQLVVYNSLCQVCTLTGCSPRVSLPKASFYDLFCILMTLLKSFSLLATYSVVQEKLNGAQIKR
jgi:hypothetical protein